MSSRNVAIVGCGSIGGILANVIDQDKIRNVELGALCDSNEEKARKLASKLNSTPDIYSDFDARGVLCIGVV